MAYRRGQRLVTFTPSFLPFTVVFRFVLVLVRIVSRSLFGIEIRGRENLRGVHRAILVSNHSLVLDPGFIAYAIWPRRAYYTMLEETALIPLLGTFVRLLGAMPLVQGSSAVGRQERGIDDALRHLGLVHFFPEGECYLRNQQIMPFHRGAFRAASRRGLPVVTVTTVLRKRVLKLWNTLHLPPRILILIGKPISPAASTKSASIACATLARQTMQATIDREGGCKTIGRGAMPRLGLHQAVIERSPAGSNNDP
jgi:1-acyl-sn-glycerol-3-phosphate acyltransferase